MKEMEIEWLVMRSLVATLGRFLFKIICKETTIA